MEKDKDNYTVTITDVVNLIIEKKIKEVDDEIDKLKEIKKELEDKWNNEAEEKSKKLKSFLEEHFDARGLESFVLNSSITMLWGLNNFGISNSSKTSDDKYKNLYQLGLMFKEDAKVYEDIYTIRDTIKNLKDKKEVISNSKEKLIAEVTLEKLSSIDVDFKENIEKLTERIFNNTKLIN